MLKKKRYKIKRTLLKTMAVLITLCYVTEPAQKELRYVFHFISHNLQMPSYVLQHETNINYQDSAKSQNSLTNHEHEILDFIDKIIGSSSEKNEHQGTSNVENFSIKEIIVHYEYNLAKDNFPTDIKVDNFKAIRCLKHKGHSLQLYKPPQLLRPS